MSSSAEHPVRDCCNCGAPSSRRSFPLDIAASLLTLGLWPIGLGRYCDECAPGADAAGIPLIVVLLPVAFVLGAMFFG
jgi:hypothetical protein